jgi:succinate dehydrogenase / fumarate reductase flavoprotein subunit
VQANTGRHIVAALDALVRTLEATPATDEVGISVAGEKLVRRLEYWRFVSLVLDDHGICVGVLAQDCRTLTFKAFPADGVVLASGDYAGLFAESAASATSSSGAALGAVYRQGAVLSNLEFVEHHPLVVGRGAARVALPELLRAKGARVTQVGRRNSTQSLDLTGLDAAPLAALVESLGPPLGQLLGVDLAREGVPVQLRALRGLGGVWVDCEPSTSDAGFSPRQHATSIPGLYAAGAADAQYHGAATLPGNLAPADLLGGQLAARGVVCFRESLSKSACDLPKSVFDKPANIAEQDLGDQFKREADRDGMGPHELLAILRSEMARLCGVSRSAEGLEALAERLVELQQKCQRVSVNGPSTGHNPDALVAATLNDQLVLARAVVNSALWREESRGAHQRSDFGTSSAAFERVSLTQATSDSGPRTLTSFDYSCAGQNVSIGK